jgi:hypothetical protein
LELLEWILEILAGDRQMLSAISRLLLGRPFWINRMIWSFSLALEENA